MNGNRPFVVLGVAALILLALFYYFGKGGKARTFNWKETYALDSKEPYGAFVFHELLASNEYPVDNITQSLKDELPENPDTVSNYIFVGQSLFLDSTDTQRLLRFVENGNNALIASKTIPYDLMFYIVQQECIEGLWDDYERSYSDTLMTMDFDHPTLADKQGYSYKYIDKFEVKRYTWHYIDSVHFCGDSSSLTSLGTWRTDNGDSNTNFAKIRFGTGHFYLHTNPIAFTNIQLLDQRRKDYAQGVLAHLPKGKNYWDAYGQQDESIGRMQNDEEDLTQASLSGKTPLQYVLSQPPLAWAWYVLLALAILYLFFKAKRRQRIIPVLHENRNTSLEFVSTVGSLYFQQKKHRNIALKQMQLFLNQVRNRYGIATKVLGTAFEQQLSQLSEVPLVEIKALMAMHRDIEQHAIPEKTLIAFNRAIEDFYEKCK